MTPLKTLRSLGPIDARNLQRDALLRWMIFVPFLLVLLFRFLVPRVRDLLLVSFGFDLAVYYPLIVSYGFIVSIPLVFGMVLGFLLLDERDDGTLIALQVTPLTAVNYLVYRLSLPMIISVFLTLFTLSLTGLSTLSLFDTLLISLLAAPLAPIFALVLATLAENKVQGFALTKALGGLMILPFVAYFINGQWQILFGLIPTYWPQKVYWLLDQDPSGIWLYVIAGLLYELFLLVLLARRFNQVLHR